MEINTKCPLLALITSCLAMGYIAITTLIPSAILCGVLYAMEYMELTEKNCLFVWGAMILLISAIPRNQDSKTLKIKIM